MKMWAEPSWQQFTRSSFSSNRKYTSTINFKIISPDRDGKGNAAPLHTILVGKKRSPHLSADGELLSSDHGDMGRAVLYYSVLVRNIDNPADCEDLRTAACSQRKDLLDIFGLRSFTCRTKYSDKIIK